MAVADSLTSLPAGLDQGELLQHLEPLARSGVLFFLVADDPVRYGIGLFTGESFPPGFDDVFEPLGGAFRLEVPSGRVTLTGWDKAGQPCDAGGIALTPGVQLLSVWARRPFDGARHAREMSQLLGAEWTYMQTVDKLGLLGCLPLVLTLMCIVTKHWHWLLYVLPLLAVSWLPYIVLKRGRRYKASERRALEQEQARPHYWLSLTPTQQNGLSGGFLRV